LDCGTSRAAGASRATGDWGDLYEKGAVQASGRGRGGLASVCGFARGNGPGGSVAPPKKPTGGLGVWGLGRPGGLDQAGIMGGCNEPLRHTCSACRGEGRDDLAAVGKTKNRSEKGGTAASRPLDRRSARRRYRGSIGGRAPGKCVESIAWKKNRSPKAGTYHYRSRWNTNSRSATAGKPLPGSGRSERDVCRLRPEGGGETRIALVPCHYGGGGKVPGP